MAHLSNACLTFKLHGGRLSLLQTCYTHHHHHYHQQQPQLGTFSIAAAEGTETGHGDRKSMIRQIEALALETWHFHPTG